MLKEVSSKLLNHDTYRRECEEGNGKDREAGSHDFPEPSLRYDVAIADCRNGYLKRADAAKKCRQVVDEL